MSILKSLLLILTFFLSNLANAQTAYPTGDTWQTVQQNKKGKIVMLWHGMDYVIFKDSNQKVRGIEYDIFESFIDYVKSTYEIDLEIQWVEAKSFQSIYNTIQTEKPNGVFGASFFSITADRKKEVNFSPPYMPDITTLISSNNIYYVDNESLFKEAFKNATALTVRHTTLEQNIKKIKEKHLPSLVITYAPNDDDMVRMISTNKNYFGYIDLPVYIKMYEEGYKTRRHNVFQITGIGYGFPYAKGSDWQKPLDDYFSSEQFKQTANQVLIKYFGNDISEIIGKMGDSVGTNASEVQIALMTKEKQVEALQAEKQEQELLLLKKEKEIDKLFKRILAITIISILLISLFIIYHLRMKMKVSRQVIAMNKKMNDIERALLEEELGNTKLREEQLKKDLEFKNKELTTYTLNFIQKQSVMEELKENVKDIKRTADDQTTKKLNNLNKLVEHSFNLDRGWDEFKLHFEQVHQNFYNALKERFPDLTYNDLKLCALIKLNLSIKEASTILGISPNSVKIARYRLRKKLQLNTEESLTDFFLDLQNQQPQNYKELIIS